MWKAIKKAINSNLNVPLDMLVKSGAIPAVKSVQRGVTSVQSEYTNTQDTTANYSANPRTIPISKVNPQKSLLLYEPYTTSSGIPTTASNLCMKLNDDGTSILEFPTGSGTWYDTGSVKRISYRFIAPAVWQVIEFY